MVNIENCEPSEATGTQVALTQVLRLYQDSHSVLGQVITEVQEMKELQDTEYQEVAGIQIKVARIYTDVEGQCTEMAGVCTKVAGLHTEVASMVGVMWDLNTNLWRAFLPAADPFGGLSTSRASTYAPATGRIHLQMALTQQLLIPPLSERGDLHVRLQEQRLTRRPSLQQNS